MRNHRKQAPHFTLRVYSFCARVLLQRRDRQGKPEGTLFTLGSILQ